MKVVLAVGLLCVVQQALAVLSSETRILAVPVGENADWGQIHAASVTLNWAWPKKAASATLEIVANGKDRVLTQDLTDTTVSSYAWACGVPAEDALYDVTITFDSGEVQTAQLTALRGSFDLGVELKGWDGSGAAKVKVGSVIPYRASWGEGVAGSSTFTVATEVSPLAYSSGYLCLRPRVRGRQLATLDFEVQPSSPAFSTYLDLIVNGVVLIFR